MTMYVSGGVLGGSGKHGVTTSRGEGGGEDCGGGAGGALLARSSCSTHKCISTGLLLLGFSSDLKLTQNYYKTRLMA